MSTDNQSLGLLQLLKKLGCRDKFIKTASINATVSGAMLREVSSLPILETFNDAVIDNKMCS